MKIKMKIRLVAEDKYSIGRLIAIVGIFFLLFGIYPLNDSLINGGFYRNSDWIFAVFYYMLVILMIVSGLLWHRRAKWPEFEEELYEDGWIKYKFYGYGRYEDIDTWLPGDLIIRVQKYKKSYSKRKKNWYVWLNIDMMYEGRVYTAVARGWLEEPKSIGEFEKYVRMIKKQIEKNIKGKEINITFSNSGHSVAYWYRNGYAAKINEERDKQIERELEYGDRKDTS